MIKKTFLLAIILSVFIVMSFPMRAEAAEFVTGPGILIGADEVVNEDVYAFAGQITVEGTINGDLVASGGSIDISGTINGDVIVAGGSISISGPIQDDIRAAGSNIQINSLVGGDVIIGGETVIIDRDAVVGDDLVVGAGTLVVRGVIEGDVDAGVADIRIDGTVLGDVEASVDNRFRLGPETRIEGALTYTSRNAVTFQPGSVVNGAVKQNLPKASILGTEVQDSTLIRIANKVISQVRWFLGTLFVGLLIIFLLPETTRMVIGTLTSSPWKSLGMGVLMLIVTPIAIIILGGIAIFIGGFAALPIAAVPGAIYFVLLMLATPLIAVLIGGFIFMLISRRDDYAHWIALVIGAAVLALLGLAPYLDIVIGVLTILFGFGMWLLFFLRQYKEARFTQRV